MAKNKKPSEFPEVKAAPDAVVRQIIKMATEGRSELRYSNRPDLEGAQMARRAVAILMDQPPP